MSSKTIQKVRERHQELKLEEAAEVQFRLLELAESNRRQLVGANLDRCLANARFDRALGEGRR